MFNVGSSDFYLCELSKTGISCLVKSIPETAAAGFPPARQGECSFPSAAFLRITGAIWKTSQILFRQGTGACSGL